MKTKNKGLARKNGKQFWAKDCDMHVYFSPNGKFAMAAVDAVLWSILPVSNWKKDQGCQNQSSG